MFNKNNVERIRKAFENISVCKWEAGDAALAEVPMSPNGVHNDASTHVLALAEAAGVASHSLLIYRRVSASWSISERFSGVSWTVHRTLMGQENRHEIIQSVLDEVDGDPKKVTDNRVRMAMGLAPNQNGAEAIEAARMEALEGVTPEQVAELIRSNPEVAMEAMREVRTAQIEQELQLKADLRNANASDFEDTSSNVTPIRQIAPAPQASTPQPTRYLHGYSPVATEIFLIDSQLDDMMETMTDEGIADADVRNDENYAALNNAYKRIVQNVMALGDALDKARAKVTAQ